MVGIVLHFALFLPICDPKLPRSAALYYCSRVHEHIQSFRCCIRIGVAISQHYLQVEVIVFGGVSDSRFEDNPSLALKP